MEYQGDVSESHSVAGINQDGSAVAGKIRTIKKAQRSKQQMFDEIDMPFYSDRYGKTVAANLLNRPEMISTVIDVKQNKDKTDHEAWADTLDIYFRESLRESAKKHLTQKSNITSKSIIASAILLQASSLGSEVLAGEPPVSLGYYGGMYAFIVGIEMIGAKKLLDTGPADLLAKRRWSVFPYGAQWDRYLAVNALTRLPGLIQVRK